MGNPEYEKVTIIRETSRGTRTTVIPKAAEVAIGYEIEHDDYSIAPNPFIQRGIHFSFTCEPLSEKDGSFISETRKPSECDIVIRIDTQFKEFARVRLYCSTHHWESGAVVEMSDSLYKHILQNHRDDLLKEPW